jgi:SSS family solute:Na+ symporter
MNMHLVDWGISCGLLVFLIWAAYKTKKYTASVADFLAANRCAGKYLLGVSEGIAGIGAVSMVAIFEMYYKAGFSQVWWFFAFNLVVLTVALTGWVVYRLRQTRALTLAQFLEMRYSRRFRIFAGIVIFISGVLNFGIFPAVGARFFLYYCGLPSFEVPVFGWLTIDLTFALIMVILLSIALFFTFLGGQIAVMVTDFIQSTFSNIVLCIIIAFVLIKIPWSETIGSLLQRPPGQSMLHPFQASSTKDFNLWYYLIYAFGIFYTTRAWLGNQGYFVSARNAHQARMGNILGWWRLRIQETMTLIIPICAFVLMHHSNWAAISGSVNDTLATIGNETIRKQVTTTLTMSRLMPIGLMGGFCAVVLAAFISTHDTYLHSWGSIFVQDVVLPLRKNRPLSPKQHINLLRWSIFGVAVFIFLFSLVFPQNEYIYMYFALTGNIWLGGAGAVIVGGLYWKRGTTAGAYGAVIIGIITAIIGFTLPRIWEWQGKDFPMNQQWLWLFAMIISTVVYVLISLLGRKSVFNMDKLLHKGKYAVADDTTTVNIEPVRGWQKILGVNRNFSADDKVIYLTITGCIALTAVIFVIVTIYNLVCKVETELWARFWHYLI